MKEALINYVRQQETIAPEVISACGRMLNGAECISAENDLRQYVAEKRTNNPKPPRAEYEPYNSGDVCLVHSLSLSLSLCVCVMTTHSTPPRLAHSVVPLVAHQHRRPLLKAAPLHRNAQLQPALPLPVPSLFLLWLHHVESVAVVHCMTTKPPKRTNCRSSRVK
jgi:hypothetical protein